MSVPPGMNVIGWYIEENDRGPGFKIVLVQPNDDPNETIEHVAETPDELWAAFEAIADDPDLPETQVINDGGQLASGDDLVGLAVDAAESFITQATGPVVGRLAGGALRNPGRALELLRMVSRKDRR
jgi:hypothetical protein